MCDVVSSVASGGDRPTGAGENDKHRKDAAAATIISLCKRYYDVAIVCVVVLVVWALLALPTIFTHRPMRVSKYSPRKNHELLVDSDFKTCMLICSSHFWGCYYYIMLPPSSKSFYFCK